MADTLQKITQSLVDAKNANALLAVLDSDSETAMWKNWIDVFAQASYNQQLIFDDHLTLVRQALDADKSHTLQWYQKMALAFQYGSALPDGSDVYDNSLLTQAQIDAQKIIKYAAAVEDNGIVTVKVAKEVNGELVPLVNDEYTAFASYINEIRDAGVKLQAISFPGDKLKVKLQVEYDPQVLSDNGARKDGTNTQPVEDAIKNYLRNLPFNGLFRVDKMIDELQKVDGIIIPTALQVQAAKNDVLNFVNINIQYQPYSGYLRIWDDNIDLDVTYTPLV